MTRTRPFRRGVAILPSLFTTGNLFLGFWSIIKALDGRFAEAAPLLGGAVVLDMLDGRIARLTGTQSDFGAELDSLAELQALLVGQHGWTLLTAVCPMLFSLLHNPCSTTIWTMYKETGSKKWTALGSVMPLAIAFAVCFAVAQTVRFFF